MATAVEPVVEDPERRARLLELVDEIAPVFAERAPAHDREASFPFANFADLREAGFYGLCVPTRYGGLGASFADYMHIGARIGRHCAMTALTFNMHTQTVLWTGIAADGLEMTETERAVHEERRADLYRRIVEDGELQSQPLSEGVARGATQGFATTAEPVEGGFRVNGRKIFASLSGAANQYNITCVTPGEEGIRFLSVDAADPGVRIVGDWDPLGMRGTVSRTLLFEDAFVPAERELLPQGAYNQLAARFPYVYMTLTPAYLGLTEGVGDFVREYMSSVPPAGVTARRDVPQKQQGWAEIQIMIERSRALFDRVVEEAAVDPTPEMMRRALASTYTTMETAPEVASLAIRVCGGVSMLREFRLEQHYRDARCGALMLPWSAEVCLDRLGRWGIFPDADGDG
jgi:alkylation response protein AidB-like acyl-CoA dehydrogenase